MPTLPLSCPSLPPNCSLITTTAVTLGGWWVGVPTRPHTPPHHPATTSSPSSPRNFFVPPDILAAAESIQQGSNQLLLTSLVAFPRLLVSPQTPTQFSHLSRYADLPWLSVGSYSTCPHPSWLSFSARMLQKLISSKRLAWLLRLVSTRKGATYAVANFNNGLQSVGRRKGWSVRCRPGKL